MTDGRERVRSVLSKIRIGIFLLSPSTERSVAQHTARSVYTADYGVVLASGSGIENLPPEERG